LRSILKSWGLWAPIGERVKALRQRHEVGRALSREDEVKLLEAIRRSDSPALLTLFVMAIDTGLRASEMGGVRYRDLEVAWKNGAIVAGRLIVPKSKTEAGTGRLIPFTRRLCVTLSSWIARFPNVDPESYISFLIIGLLAAAGSPDTIGAKPECEPPRRAARTGYRFVATIRKK
jgi:integrase